jgi:hypothetical protein
MDAPNGTGRTPPGTWVVSEGRLTRLDPTEFDPEAERGVVKEYRLSEIGRYLLNPGPVEIRKRLVGCEVHPASTGLARVVPRLLRRSVDRRRRTDVILSGLKLKLPSLKDADLEAHLRRMVDELRVFDPFGKKLARLDTKRIAHLVGICEDTGGGYSYLKLQGSTEDKIRYLNSHVGRDVRVTIHRAHVSEGLFELRAFPTAGFNPANAYRLYAYTRDGQPAACVLTAIGNLDFRLPDPQAVKYASLIENTLKFCAGFRKAFEACFAGAARPVRLLFNRQLEVDYSKANFPEIYRDAFRASETAATHRNLVKPVLNYMQTAVSLSYLPSPDRSDERLVTHICVLHDVRALEPLRKSLPAVYAEMNRRAFSTEAGRFYVLDSIAGAAHAD